MPIYRPSCRVRVQLRLDELDDTQGVQAKLERGAGSPSVGATAPTTAIPDTTVAENRNALAALNQNRANVSPPEYRRELSRLHQERGELMRRATGGAGTGTQEAPISLREDDSDEKNVIFDFLPRDALIGRNGLHDASTIDLTLDYRDLPIDPRAVRACLVGVVIGTVSADDYAAGMLEQRRRPDGSLLSVVSRTPGQENWLKSSTRFVGFVDNWYTEHTDDGDVVRLSGRDVSALLRDQKMPEGQSIDMTKPIIAGIRELVDKPVMTRGMRVVYGTPFQADGSVFVFDEDGPVPAASGELGPVPADSVGRTRKGRKGQAVRSTRRSDHEESMWDHIVKTVVNLGLVPVLRGFTLYILEPRTFGLNETFGRRKMVWGANLSSVTFERKLGGVRSPTIEIRCADPAIGRTRWARYPVLDGEPSSGILGKEGSPQPVQSRANKISPNGQSQEEVQVEIVRGVTDLEALERIAANSYEMISRQELHGSFETDDLESFDTTEEADLLDLQPGNPIEILVARPESQRASDAPSTSSDNETTLQKLNGMSSGARAAYLRSLGFAEKVAQRLAAAQERVRLLPLFRTKNANIAFSVDEGVRISVDFENYVVVREDTDTRRIPK